MALRSWLMRSLVLAAAYYVVGRVALLLAIPPGYATAVWPAAGVALAGLLTFGSRAWPGTRHSSLPVPQSDVYPERAVVSALGQPLCHPGLAARVRTT